MTVNLLTGEQYAPRREDYCTKISPVVAMDGGCPLWRAFLARVTDGDDELQAYLARVCGYWLTGHTHEHALFFLYGLGGNGRKLGAIILTARCVLLPGAEIDRHGVGFSLLNTSGSVSH